MERFPLRLKTLYIEMDIYNQLQLKYKRQVKDKITEIITKNAACIKNKIALRYSIL